MKSIGFSEIYKKATKFDSKEKVKEFVNTMGVDMETLINSVVSDAILGPHRFKIAFKFAKFMDEVNRNYIERSKKYYTYLTNLKDNELRQYNFLDALKLRKMLFNRDVYSDSYVTMEESLKFVAFRYNMWGLPEIKKYTPYRHHEVLANYMSRLGHKHKVTEDMILDLLNGLGVVQLHIFIEHAIHGETFTSLSKKIRLSNEDISSVYRNTALMLCHKHYDFVKSKPEWKNAIVLQDK